MGTILKNACRLGDATARTSTIYTIKPQGQGLPGNKKGSGNLLYMIHSDICRTARSHCTWRDGRERSGRKREREREEKIERRGINDRRNCITAALYTSFLSEADPSADAATASKIARSDKNTIWHITDCTIGTLSSLTVTLSPVSYLITLI